MKHLRKEINMFVVYKTSAGNVSWYSNQPNDNCGMIDINNVAFPNAYHKGNDTFKRAICKEVLLKIRSGLEIGGAYTYKAIAVMSDVYYEDFVGETADLIKVAQSMIRSGELIGRITPKVVNPNSGNDIRAILLLLDGAHSRNSSFYGSIYDK